MLNLLTKSRIPRLKSSTEAAVLLGNWKQENCSGSLFAFLFFFVKSFRSLPKPYPRIAPAYALLWNSIALGLSATELSST